MTAVLSEGRRINPPSVGDRSWFGQPPALTRREFEVLAALALGDTQKQVAARQFVSQSTIHSHVEHALRRLGVQSLVQAMNALGWVRLP